MEMYLGEKIRCLREHEGLNQSQLGAIVHMSQRKISYIECGKYEPGIDDIISFCNHFHVSADYLLGLPRGLPYPFR